MSTYGVILFHTSSKVFQTEKLFNQAKLKFKLIPTPREFSSDCGMAIRFDWNNLSQINNILNEMNIETAGIHKFT